MVRILIWVFRRIAFATLAFTLSSSAVFAWKASVDGAICRLDHEGEVARASVTYDPASQLSYSIELTWHDGRWSAAPVFAIDFIGIAPLSISTDRHRLSANGETLSVSDSGFGNVLRGIESNSIAVAHLGEQTMGLSLDGAAPEVQKFRDCTIAPSV